MDPSPSVPAQRAADADREAASEAVRSAGADGRLTLEEMEHRLAAVFAAKTHPELDSLLGDLQGHSGPSTAGVARTQGQAAAQYPAGPEVPRTLTILGDSQRRGFWRPARESRVVTVLGDATIDMGEADLTRPVTQMRVVTVLGETTIEVPDDVNVHVSKTTLLGENDVELPPYVPQPGAPELHIHLVTILGQGKVRFSRTRRRSTELRA